MNTTPTRQRDLPGTLLKVACFSVVLGIAIELLLILALFLFNKLNAGSPKPLLAETAQKVSWSFLVCTGISVGTAAQRARPAVMGLLGVLAAPVAFVIARATHKGASTALGTDFPPGSIPGVEVLALIKAVQYGTFGALLGVLSRRPWGSRLIVFVSVGLVAGAVFGGLVLWLAFRNVPAVDPAKFVARAINELLFPVGCAIVLWSATAIGRQVSSPSETAALD